MPFTFIDFIVLQLHIELFNAFQVERNPLICVLGVPNHTTYADFCQFCGPFIQNMLEMRIVRLVDEYHGRFYWCHRGGFDLILFTDDLVHLW